MTVARRVAAALRAQAAGLDAGVPVPVRRGRVARGWSGLPGWGVLAIAVLLGVVAGALAGLVSVW